MAEKIGAAMQLMNCGKIYPQGIEVAPGIAKSTLQGNIGLMTKPASWLTTRATA